MFPILPPPSEDPHAKLTVAALSRHLADLAVKAAEWESRTTQAEQRAAAAAKQLEQATARIAALESPKPDIGEGVGSDVPVRKPRRQAPA